MSGIATDILLAISVGAIWLGCAGFVRLHDPLDRLHCVTFVTVAAGFGVLLASLACYGADTSVLKVLFLVISALINGAVLSHATGRALLYRSQDEPDAP